MRNSPLSISIALHYWTSPGDYSPDNAAHAGSPAVRDCLKAMLGAQLLEMPGRDGAKYGSGPALQAYVEALCAIPWPVQQWVVPAE